MRAISKFPKSMQMHFLDALKQRVEKDPAGESVAGARRPRRSILTPPSTSRRRRAAQSPEISDAPFSNPD
jgi:hypothetical protein